MQSFSIMLPYFTNIRQRFTKFTNLQNFPNFACAVKNVFLLKSSIVVKGAVVVIDIIYIFKRVLSLFLMTVV